MTTTMMLKTAMMTIMMPRSFVADDDCYDNNDNEE